LLSVAPNSLTGMLTIPKLIEPLQIARAMLAPPDASPGACRWSGNDLGAKAPLPVFFHIGSSLSTGLST
jgi:hypothetical protein